MDVSALPFNKHLGLTVGEVAGVQAVVLQPAEHHLNHVGTVHATVLYGLAEAASGHCLLSRFPELAGAYRAVLRKSEAKYRRPASVGPLLHARGTLDGESADRLLSTLETRGRATIDVRVVVAQGDAEVFTGTFSWFAAARDA